MPSLVASEAVRAGFASPGARIGGVRTVVALRHPPRIERRRSTCCAGPSSGEALWAALEGAPTRSSCSATRRASRPAAGGGARARPPVLRRARVGDRRRTGRDRAGQPRPPPAGGVARAAAPRRRRAAWPRAAHQRRRRARLPSCSAGRAGADRARLPGRLARREGLCHPRPLPRSPPDGPDLRAPGGRRGRAGARRLPGRLPTSPEHGEPGGRPAPDDYERAQAPVYAFLFALAQAGATPRIGWAAPTLRRACGRRSGAATAGRPAYAAGCSARSRSRVRSGSPTVSGWGR